MINKPTHMGLARFIQEGGFDEQDIIAMRNMADALQRLCKELGVQVIRYPDERYGTVNGYPMEALEEYFTL
jgi:hypothetical protein